MSADSEPINGSSLAIELLRIGQYVESFDRRGGPSCCAAVPALALIFRRLADLGEVQILQEAIELYEKLDGEIVAAYYDQQQRWKNRYAEQLRQHEIAITVECPYCGAAPDEVCRTAGPTGLRHSKGTSDHKDRLRAAKRLLDERTPELAIRTGGTE
jgi:hypothetical protein